MGGEGAPPPAPPAPNGDADGGDANGLIPLSVRIAENENSLTKPTLTQQ